MSMVDNMVDGGLRKKREVKSAGGPAGIPSRFDAGAQSVAQHDPCIRAENEDDDGYDPYSDRRPEPEPLFERDPWS